MKSFQLLLLYFLLAAVCCTHSAEAQWVGDSVNDGHIIKGIHYVYNLTFDSAKTEFQQVIKSRPDHPAGYFFLAMTDWWKIVIDINNTSHDKRFLSELDRVIEMCDKKLDTDDNDVTALFFKGGALGFQGRLYANREDWVKAANAGREALPIVQKAYKLAPDNNDILLGIGIYNYYAAVVPEQYPFVKPFMIFFPKGNRVKGLKELRTASEKARYAKTEATYVLLVALQTIERSYGDALQLALKLYSEFPNNVIFHKYVGRCYAASGNWDEMHRVYLEILDRVNTHRPGYDTMATREADYYLGLYEMQAGHNDRALEYFYQSDELSRTLDANEFSGFMTLTNLRIGMIYDIQKKRELAITQYQKVLKMKDIFDAHKQAEQYITSPYQKP